jgi:type 1 glutamine amidotransferase
MSDSQVTRRKFFVHSAHGTVGVSASLASLGALALVEQCTSTEQPPRPLRVCLVSGAKLYQSDESLAAFQQHLEQRYPVKCSRAFRKADDDLPGLEALDQCDCAVIFTRRMTIAGEQLERIRRYCGRGGALIGLRTASHGLHNWLAMDKEVFGGDYQNHYQDDQPTAVKIAAAAKDHPVLAGVEPFTSRGTLYINNHLAPDTTVLLTGSIPGHAHPVAWVRLHQGGRVFYTSLGHPDDFTLASFLRLLLNALAWTTRRNL